MTQFDASLLNGVQTIQAVTGDKLISFHLYAWDNREAGRMKETWDREDDSYTHQTNDPNFQNLPEAYRVRIREAWLAEYMSFAKIDSQGGIPVTTRNRIYAACGF